MNEPLTNSGSKTLFTGKTYNNHPQWYNQPLRLTKEQKKDPLPVLGDFFECYHLNETREILWEWLTEVVSSPRSISSDHHDRSNHVYFYEKLEGVIEAAFVMKNKIHKHRRRQEKRRLKKGIRPEKDLFVKVQVNNINSVIDKPVIETAANEDIFNKPKQLIEYVDEAAMYVIAEVFKNESLAFLRDQLRDLRYVALSADCSIYEDGEQRGQLLSFHDQLLELIEALFIIYNQNTEKSDLEKRITEADKPRLLSQDQIANPMQVLTDFFQKFPITYSIRELNDWLEASICFAGTYPENMSELQALYTYRNILCLIKSANRLLAH